MAFWGFLVDQLVKNLPAMQETPGSVPESGSSPGEGIGYPLWHSWGFPGGSDSKESGRKSGDLGSIPGLGRSPRGRHGNPLQYYCLENPMDRGAWGATAHGAAQSRTQLSN